MIAMAAGLGIGRFVYTPILPEMIGQLGLSAGEAGLIASANFLGYLVGAVVAAMPGLPGTRRRWVVWSLWVNVIVLAAAAVTAWLPALLVIRFASGVASAFVVVFASATVFDAVRRAQRPGLIRLHFVGPGLGIILSTVLVGLAIAWGADWRSDWLIAALPCIVAALVFTLFMPPEPEQDRQTGTNTSMRSAPGMGRITLSYGLFGFGYVITATFLLNLIRESDAAVHLEPITWLAFGLAAMPSVTVWTWIAARMGVLNAYALACFVEALGVALSVVWQTPTGFIVSAVLLGVTLIGITALGFQAAGALLQGDTRRPFAAMTAAFGVGQIVGPVVAGLAKDLTGSLLAVTLAAAGALVAASVLGWSVNFRRSPSPAGPTDAVSAPSAAAATIRRDAAGTSHPGSHDAPHAAGARCPSHGG